MMLNDAMTLVSWRSRPRSFVALMSLYESNYLRLASLAGDLRQLAERSPYTTSLDLTYLFRDENGGEAGRLTTYPDMRVRVYHDARLVEAQEWATQHVHETLRRLRGAAERELDQRWARNTMLNKWLEYCIDRGHGLRV
jgi:uncharacterized protein YqiB (DUF1249 family)